MVTASLPFASSRMAAHSWHNYNTKRQILTMTVCPIAIVNSCKKCLAFKICPLKGVIGDVPSAKKSKSPSGTPGQRK